jgi:ABC-type branched-subunit amino acid transport system ATPase component
LLGFRSAGGTVGLATHSFGGGLAVADRVAILVGGRFALEQAASDLAADELRRVYDALTEGDAASLRP